MAPVTRAASRNGPSRRSHMSSNFNNPELYGGAALPSQIDLTDILRRVYSWVCAGLVVCFRVPYFVGQIVLGKIHRPPLPTFFTSPWAYICPIFLYFVLAVTP